MTGDSPDNPAVVAAAAVVPAHADHPGRPIAELDSAGMLWLINRRLFMPRGLVLVLHTDPLTHHATGWCLHGDGQRPLRYDAQTNAAGLAAAAATLAAHTPGGGTNG